MKRILCILLGAAFASACAQKPPEPTEPRGAFARLAPCINREDAKCLYNELDRDSRWSIQTMHKVLVEMRTIVDSSYPSEKKGAAMGAWAQEARAAGDAELFEIFCDRRRCMEDLIAGFGAITELEPSGGDRAVVATTRGGRFSLDRRDGRYGLSTWQAELQQSKIRLLDRLEQVKQNARDFEETRRAGGLGGVKKEGVN